MKRSLLLPFLGVLACESAPTGPSAGDDAMAFTITDFGEYVLPDSPTERVIVRWTFSNRTGSAVWIVDCGGPFPGLEKLVDGEWELAFPGGSGLDCLGAHRIEPGAQLRGEGRFAAGYPFVQPPPGTFRLFWPDAVWNFDGGSPPFGDLLPPEFRVSNRFSLR